MKHRNLKLAIIAVLLGSISSIGAMGRVIQKITQKYTDPVYSKAAVFPKRFGPKTTQQWIESTKQWTEKASYPDLLLTGKKQIQNTFDTMLENVKKGISPSNEELDKFCRHSLAENYWILNQADQAGHTLLKYALENGNFSYTSKRFIKALVNRGAALNNRDKYVLGDERLLKTYLNVPLTAPATTTVKVLRTFWTKTKNKLQNYEQMKPEELDALIEKTSTIGKLYSKIEDKLLTQREVERLVKK